ncbi:alpha-amylase family glycosyl hydrolase [Litorimonas cladophorae]|uniref:alpha-amylase family glycosyl hydrolase n=1 Tax=Litorimonas cladophorae TaxID=1220491 RepID=UPI0016774D9F|nr:alpha-amylase family glycosyl hydrolase [Litorimonas cladophorae]
MSEGVDTLVVEDVSPAHPASDDAPWWKGALIYQIYPRSFQDTNRDGIGDLPGITRRLEYIASLGVSCIWISPFFTSPMADYGYDVSDFCDVDPIFGTLADFDILIKKAHTVGLKVIIDQVYSHTSDQHEWFIESRSSRTNDKSDWYVWADAKADGSPPNNWQSVFGMGAWQWDARRGQYYLHNFLVEQPDLNLHNPVVQAAILDVTQFWLDRGVDGFRIDALNFAMHDRALRDNPAETEFKRPPTRPFDFQRHEMNMSQPELLPFIERIGNVIQNAGAEKFTVAEVGGPRPLSEMKSFTQGNKRLSSAYAFDYLYAEQISADLVRKTQKEWPGIEGEGWPSWAFENHDAPRAVTRWKGSNPSKQYSKLLVLLMAALRGNGFIYYGEELGLEQGEIDFDDLKDPEAIANWPETLGRDGARTPMPWDGNTNVYAGFSDAKPWLPLQDNHASASVALQSKDPKSVLNFTKQVIALRNGCDVLRRGEIQFPSEGELLVFDRMHGGKIRRCVFNLGDNNLAYDGQVDIDVSVGSVGSLICPGSGFISKAS